MPGIVEPFPAPLPWGGADTATAPYKDLYNSYHVAIGGIPFLTAFSLQEPFIRKSAEFRKTQVDQSTEPGEQSLTGWWVRSQLSFHGGAGLKFNDPALDDSASFRFDSSEGVDIWTPGQVTLLKKTTKVVTTSNQTFMVGAHVGSTDLVVYGQGTALGGVNSDGVTTYSYTNPTPTTSNWQAIASDGESVYLASKDGVWKLDFSGGNPATPTVTKLWAYTGSTQNTCLGWVKGRLMAGVDTKVYELVPPVGAPPHALPGTAVYTSLVPGWRWTSVTAGPEAIYVSGLAGNRGSILKVTLDSAGALPALTGATEVAQLPTGETPLVIRAYLGTVMTIGTNLGVRVASIEDGGELSYGPLLRTPTSILDVASRDRFVYCALTNGTAPTDPGIGMTVAGLLRVDLGLKHATGQYAHATDLKADVAGTVRSVANIGDTDRIAFAVDSQGIYFQHTTDLVTSGYLRVARARYNMLWPKLFKRFALRATLVGTVSIATIDDAGAESIIATVDDTVDLSQDIAINLPSLPQESLGLRLTLNRATATTGPTVRGYQLKATPGGPRPRSFVVPLLCFDEEKDSDNDVVGQGDRWGITRLERLEDLHNSGQVVLFEDLKLGQGTLVTIEDYEFRQTSPPGAISPWGGILTVAMRTVD